mgnify:CR=1 FL=1
MANVSITVVSKCTDFKMTSAMFRTFAMTCPDIDIAFVNECNNNTRPLTQIYNEDLERDRKAGNIDFHVFLHADVFFDMKQFFADLLKC